MPTATKKPAPGSATVHETVIRKEVREPIEIDQTPPPAPPPEPVKDFWGYIEQLNAEDWKNHHVTLYRYPLGQTKPQKVGRYIRTYKFDSPLQSEMQIYEEYGGGQYDAWLKGPNSEGRVVLLAKHSWEMEGPSKSPAVSSAPTGGSDLASTLQVVLSNLQNARGSIADPAIKESISLIQQLTNAMPKPQGIGELVGALRDMQALTGGGGGAKSELKETLSLLKEMGIIGEDSRRKSLAEELKDIMEIAGMMGGGGGGKTDWATSLVQNLPSILEKVQPIADKFADAARSNERTAEMRAGAPPARPQAPAALPPAKTGPAAESPADVRRVAPPETEPATPAAQAPQNGEIVQPPNLIWAKARAVQLFAEGKGGDQIAEWLDMMDARLGDFLGSMDEEKFAAFVGGDEILRQIGTAPRFTEFVRDFVAYFAEETETTPPAEK